MTTMTSSSSLHGGNDNEKKETEDNNFLLTKATSDGSSSSPSSSSSSSHFSTTSLGNNTIPNNCNTPDVCKKWENKSNNAAISCKLMPYKYQVHGHHIILKWTPKTVIKNTNEREELFYETFSKHCQVLKPWIPKYKGHVHVRHFKEDENIHLTVTSTDVEENGLSTCKLKIHQGKLEIFNEGNSQTTTMYPGVISDTLPISQISLSHLNPWSIFTLIRRLPRLDSSTSKFSYHRFVVLEDINNKFTCPNILDLKMGTIPLGLGDKCDEKRLEKEKKWSSTTSAQVGVRVDGMQVFSPIDQNYRCYNKFYGYALGVEDLEGLFEEFLIHYDENIKKAIVVNLLHNLERLQNIIENLSTYRFFSASIMIVTEGRLTRVYRSSPFSTISPTTSPSHLPHAHPHSHLHSPLKHSHSLATPTTTTTTTMPSTTCQQNETKSSQQEPHLLSYVDLRLVDFEHTTFAGFMENDLVHDGPDHGFLMGLSFLRRALNRYLELHRTNINSSAPAGPIINGNNNGTDSTAADASTE